MGIFEKTVGTFSNVAGNRKVWEAEIGQKGGAVFGAKHERGEYDHRKAERGQNAYGAGGRRVISDRGEELIELDPIEDRIQTFKDQIQEPETLRSEPSLLQRVASLLRIG